MIGHVRFQVVNPDGTHGHDQWVSVGGTIIVPQRFTVTDDDATVELAGVVTTRVEIMEVIEGDQ